MATERSDLACIFEGDEHFHLYLPQSKSAEVLELAARLRVLEALLTRIQTERNQMNQLQRHVLEQTYADSRSCLEQLLDQLDPAHTSVLRHRIEAIVPKSADDMGAGKNTVLDKLRILIGSVCYHSTTLAIYQ